MFNVEMNIIPFIKLIRLMVGALCLKDAKEFAEDLRDIILCVYGEDKPYITMSEMMHLIEICKTVWIDKNPNELEGRLGNTTSRRYASYLFILLRYIRDERPGMSM